MRETFSCRRWGQSYRSSAGCLPAERDVDGHLVDLPLVREAIVTGVGQQCLTVIVRIHGIGEAPRASLQAYVSLREWLSLSGWGLWALIGSALCCFESLRCSCAVVLASRRRTSPSRTTPTFLRFAEDTKTSSIGHYGLGPTTQPYPLGRVRSSQTAAQTEAPTGKLGNNNNR